MNERIKELISQAQKEVWGNNTYNGSPEFEGYELDAEKFAELIVKECVDTLMKPSFMEWDEAQRSELSDYNEGWVNGRLLGIEHIKEHFGVEK